MSTSSQPESLAYPPGSYLPQFVRTVETENQAKAYIDRVWNNDPFMIMHMYGRFAGSAKFWELGELGGGYMIGYINPGFWCEVAITVSDPVFMGRKHYWRHFAMLEYVFRTYDLLRIVSHVGDSNKAAHNLNKGLGLRPVGTVEDWGYTKDGQLENATVYQLTRREVLG